MSTTDAKKGARIAEVLRLSLTEGLSVRAISRRLGMSRKTVRRILGGAFAGARATRRAPTRRLSLLTPYESTIRQLLEDTPEIRAPAVLERLRPLGYQGGISILRDRLRQLRPPPTREAFLTLDFAPGAALQVDWADFGFSIPGCPRRVSAFVMALCYSRHLYLEFALSQSMGSFLRCLERGLRFYGGTTAIEIFDNMKTVVRSVRPQAFNLRFLDYATARGFSVVACNPGQGHEKGRVERPIGFVRERFWPGRRPRDLLDLNTQAASWRDDFANARIHEVTRKVPALVFEHDEKSLLKPLPESSFDTDDLDTQTVTKSFRITFDRNRYSVPWRLVGQTVLVRANEHTLGVFLGPKQVALHPRSWNVGDDIEHPSHRASLLAERPRASAGSLPPTIAGLGQTAVRYFHILAASRRSVRREVLRITFLAEIFGDRATGEAMDQVMATGHVGAEYVEYVLRHHKGLQPAPPPLRLGDPALDNLSFSEPDLSVYDRLVPTPMTRDPDLPPDDTPNEESPDDGG